MEDLLENLVLEDASGPESPITKEELCMEIDPPFKNVVNAEDWRGALNKVVPAVVVLRITTCRAFDTQSAGSSYATGFVVDKCRGIILTNRHVVKPGPVVAEAMFVNREETPVYPIYRDPVHDFGFFRYDPSAIKFLSYEEVPLAPEAACVGLEIRVVGNDSGEKVSILSGTLARLDRDAPNYTKNGYNDFNTFYIQAASGTKGGSSGSPVIDCQGRAVALNAGGRSLSASAFYLPLERVMRALKFLREGRVYSTNKWEAVSIPRGTLQATFIHKGFDETRRLGLQSETEQLVRNSSPPDETGMLVVDSVVPGGPAYNRLEPGDILLRMNGEVITQFLRMEIILDDSVKQKVELQIERGGISLTINLVVQDLHSITPDYFLEVSGAVMHPLSYQQARNFHFSCGLVYVAEPGYLLYRAGVPCHAIIKKFAGKDISRLEDLISVLSKLCRGVRVPLQYISCRDRHRRKSVLVTIDHHEWYAPPQIYTRDDNSGLWIAKPAFSPGSLLLSGIDPVKQDLLYNTVSSCAGESSPMDGTPQHVGQNSTDDITNMETSYKCVAEEENSSADGIVVSDCSLQDLTKERLMDTGTVDAVVVKDDEAELGNASIVEHAIESTLVMFEVHVPSSCMLDGIHSQHLCGTGVIVYHSETMGLVVVDKNTVAVSASDILLSFAAFPIEIPGQVVFLHPVHNFAVVAYDPKALGTVGASAVRAAELLPEPPLCRGDTVSLVGLSRNIRAKSRKSIVTNPCATLTVASADCPRYKATNMEVIELDTDFGASFSGVLTDECGRVQALWGSFSAQVHKHKHLSSKTRSKKLKYGSNSSENHQFVRGIPILTISQVLAKIISGAAGPPLLINGVKQSMPLVRILEVELYPLLLSKARNFGLSDSWIQVLVKKDPTRHQVLRVKGCFAGSGAKKVLEQGDMILAISKQPVTCFRDIEDACQALDQCSNSDGKLNMTIFRQGREIEVVVGSDVRDGNGSTHAINWCGCTLQDAHPAVRALGFLPKEGHGVYVSRMCRGSPAHRYHLYALQWIVEINGKATPDLDAFVNATKELKHGEFVRVRTVQLDEKARVLTLKQDLHYWPTWELRFDPHTATWRRTLITTA
ncbi:PREDICTED: protease Do-like 7 isoform X2 [Ipomoea nil]|uniref:protease Do-like 7 isoform X2 n=1 Tax=Ipomoea nil TaxID=35883 RepID=UPI000901B4A4|nr:PREDICTED: protease Do-like 7 isoform X2 [Ipomoea nil]